MAALTVRTAAGLALAVIAAAAPAAAGEIYKWKDANGVTHYSDSPPPNRSYENRRVSERSAAVAGTEPAKPAESADCRNARANLERLDSNAQVGLDKDGDGKPDSLLTPEQRAAQKELMQAAIKVHCAPATAQK